MKAIAGVYLKLFVITGVPFGLLLGLPLVVIGTSLLGDRFLPVGIVIALVVGTSFGGWMALLVGSSHIYAVKKRGFALMAENLSSAQSKTFIIGLGYEEAFLRCLSSVKLLKHVRIEPAMSDETGLIHARTRRQKIRISLRRRSEQSTFITLSCRPKSILEIVDYGRSLQTAANIVDFVQGEHSAAGAHNTKP
jgi:hypothetical protein